MASHPEIPLGSRERITITIGGAGDLAGSTVEVAFTLEDVADRVWHPATWAEYGVAGILIVEPGAAIAGSVELDAGYYRILAQISRGDERIMVPAGTLEVYDLASEAYARWGMTVVGATALTGKVGISARDLDRAEAELSAYLGTSLTPSAYWIGIDAATSDPRALAFGRAVAWQAAYRQDTPVEADADPAAIASESIGSGDYAVTYAGSGQAVSSRVLASRAWSELLSGGWTAQSRAGKTRP